MGCNTYRDYNIYEETNLKDNYIQNTNTDVKTKSDNNENAIKNLSEINPLLLLHQTVATG